MFDISSLPTEAQAIIVRHQIQDDERLRANRSRLTSLQDLRQNRMHDVRARDRLAANNKFNPDPKEKQNKSATPRDAETEYKQKLAVYDTRIARFDVQIAKGEAEAPIACLTAPRILSELERFSSSILEEVLRPEIVLIDGERDIADALPRFRENVRLSKAVKRAAENEPLPAVEVKKAARRQIHRLAARGVPMVRQMFGGGDINWPRIQGPATVGANFNPQGYYKSTALRVLFGDEWFSDADLGSLRDKDAAMKLRGIWLQEFAEIGSLTRADADTLKAFLSRAVDRQRDPYDRMLSEVPRRSVCAATVNESGYLKDATGGRRFWPLELHSPIDVSKLARDRDQLWAEASTLEECGEALTLPEALWPVAAELQKGETADNPWESIIADFLEQRERDHENYFSNFDLTDDEDDEPPSPPDRIHADDLMNALDIPKVQRSTGQAQRLRTTMETMGWEHRRQVKIDGQNRAGYVKKVES